MNHKNNNTEHFGGEPSSITNQKITNKNIQKQLDDINGA